MGMFALVPLPMAQNLTHVHHWILWHSARVGTSTLSTREDAWRPAPKMQHLCESGRAIPICIKMGANSSGTDQTPTSSIKRAVAPHNWPVPSRTSSPLVHRPLIGAQGLCSSSCAVSPRSFPLVARRHHRPPRSLAARRARHRTRWLAHRQYHHRYRHLAWFPLNIN